MKTFYQTVSLFIIGLGFAFISPNCNGQQIIDSALIQYAPRPSLSAQSEPTWYPYVIARGADRTIIENTPIEQRPYRPMHFYGNTVRRTYYRGTPLALPTDFSRGTFASRRR